VQRVLIAGSSGAGKSTLAAELARRLQLPYTELDSLFHGPGWVPRSEFLDDVETVIAADSWVSEWQYDQARPLLLARADTLIWLDFPRRTVMQRVLRRSLRRALLRERAFNDNTENVRAWLDPGHPIRWAWSHHEHTRAKAVAAIQQRPDLTVIRFRSPAEVRRWLASV